jgi:hypothetical membrane protein
MFLVMAIGNAKIAGTLLLIGGVQFVIALVIAEAIYPAYSTSANYISDLGVWGRPSAVIFNPSIVLFGSLNLVSSYFVKKEFKLGSIAYIFALAGVGTLTVGLFPENTVLVNGFPVIHSIAALLTFVIGGVAAIASYKFTKSPFRIISVILGTVTLLAFVLFMATMDFGYLGLGVGGMERMIVYPTILWILSLGGYLLNS